MAGASSKAQAEGRTIVWVDESGFYLLPAAVRTYAPRGRTPRLRVPLSHDHLSVMGGLTAAGQLLLQTQAHAYRGPDVVGYLKHLLRHLPGKLLVIWDGSPIHRAQPVKAFLAQGGSQRIHLEQLPGYAPELNPAEGLWQQLKHGELRNVCCCDLVHLRAEFHRAVERLRHKHPVLRSCITRCGYTLSAEAPRGSPSTT